MRIHSRSNQLRALWNTRHFVVVLIQLLSGKILMQKLKDLGTRLHRKEESRDTHHHLHHHYQHHYQQQQQGNAQEDSNEEALGQGLLLRRKQERHTVNYYDGRHKDVAQDGTDEILKDFGPCLRKKRRIS